MATQTPTKTRIRFGLFEADLQSGELWKSGRKIKMQGQPFRVLCALSQRPGEVVSREELQALLWGKHPAGDFDQSLGTAINKVREALGDSADNPRFVETLARRGYRFIAPVSVFHPAPVDLTTLADPDLVDLTADFSVEMRAGIHEEPLVRLREPIANADLPRSRRAPTWRILFGVLALAAAGWAGYWLGSGRIAAMPRIERLTRTERIAPGIQAFESLPASVTDGLRIFTSVISDGRSVMALVDVHTGDVQHMTMPSEISSPTLGDLSPDGASLLLRSHLSPESEQPLWMVPTAGGSAMRLSNVVAHDATWMPDGKAVLYAAGNQLTIHQLGDGSSKLFATLPGRAFWLRWSPDGEVLRFTLLDPVNHTVGIWQVGRDGLGAKAILTGWSQPPSECCGSWTGDGKFYLFQANVTGSSDLWSLSGKRTTNPRRITNGPISFVAPMTSRLGHQIYFLGLETQSSLLQFDSKRKAFVPAPEFMAAANRVEYSRDKQWVIWTDQQGHLWRARADGSERIQVTPGSLEVFLARWSPDGKQIALMAREAGKAWHLYALPPDGGTPLQLLNETRNEADPSWSKDGREIVFGRVTDIMGKEDGPRALELLDLKTGKLSQLPGSDGLFSPRWSPDGRYIAAISLDQRKLMLLDLHTQIWRTLAVTSVADPVWTPDSRAIYFHADQAEMQPIYRATIPDGRLEQVANLSSFVGGETADYFFCGLTQDDNPVVRSRTGTGDVYSLNLDATSTETR
jgi:Tol biopolymer transport system component/DNA-binding winged helix-turn-helix (wHTH) protein